METELITELYLLLHCDNCNKIIDIEGDYHIVDSYFNWCCNCYHEKYFDCDQCGGSNEVKDMVIDRDEVYCKWCYEDLKKEGYNNGA